jgi:hypothetical protein
MEEANMTDHTPGPWTTTYWEHGGYDCMAASIDIREVNAIIDLGEPMYDNDDPDNRSASPLAQANARLIAAAPDLLAALQDLMFAEGGEPGMTEEQKAAWLQALNAIAKATQEVQG